MKRYLFAVQTEAEGVEICATELEVDKVSDVSARADTNGNVEILNGTDPVVTGYAPAGMPLRLCRWPAGKLDTRAKMRPVQSF